MAGREASINFVYMIGNVTIRGYSELPVEWESVIPTPVGHYRVPRAVPRSVVTVAEGEQKVRRFDIHPPASSEFTCVGKLWVLLTGDTDHCYGVNCATGEVRLIRLPSTMKLGVADYPSALVVAGEGYVARIRADTALLWRRRLWCTEMREPIQMKMRVTGAEGPDDPPTEMVLDVSTGETVTPDPPAPPPDAHYSIRDGQTFVRTDCPMCGKSGQVEAPGDVATTTPLSCPYCKGKGYVEMPSTFEDAIDACGTPVDDVWGREPLDGWDDTTEE